MTTSFALALIILAVLAGSLWYIVKAEGGYEEIPHLLERAGVPINFQSSIFNFQKKSKGFNTKPSQAVPAEFQSGNSRFSQGSCIRAENCFVGGCSSEVCGANPDIATTCEFSESFPNEQKYSCTCLSSGVCGWE